MKNEIEDKRASVKDKGREREREGEGEGPTRFVC